MSNWSRVVGYIYRHAVYPCAEYPSNQNRIYVHVVLTYNYSLIINVSKTVYRYYVYIIFSESDRRQSQISLK